MSKNKAVKNEKSFFTASFLSQIIKCFSRAVCALITSRDLIFQIFISSFKY